MSPHEAPATRYVLMGVAGAGKSAVGERLADALLLAFVEGDRLHPPENVARMSAGIPLTDEDRRTWLERIADRLRDARARQVGLVVSCSALKRRYRDVLRAADPDVRFVYLSGSPALLAERLAHREGHFMPAALLASQFEALQPPDVDERPWTVDVGAPVEDVVAQLLAHVAHARRTASSSDDAP